jgi:hypothetical protein
VEVAKRRAEQGTATTIATGRCPRPRRGDEAARRRLAGVEEAEVAEPAGSRGEGERDERKGGGPGKVLHLESLVAAGDGEVYNLHGEVAAGAAAAAAEQGDLGEETNGDG